MERNNSTGSSPVLVEFLTHLFTDAVLMDQPVAGCGRRGVALDGFGSVALLFWEFERRLEAVHVQTHPGRDGPWSARRSGLRSGRGQ